MLFFPVENNYQYMYYVMDGIEGLMFVAFAWKLNAKITTEKKDVKMMVLLKTLSNPIALFFFFYVFFYSTVYNIRFMYYDILAQDILNASSAMIGELCFTTSSFAIKKAGLTLPMN